jgi:hypothetical protein
MKRRKLRICLWFMGVVLMGGMLVGPAAFSGRPMQRGGEDQLDKDNEAKMEKQRQDDAFNKLKENAEKFYQGAGELKEMVENSNRHTYSLQIIKKTEELEKLLKDIRRRAKEGN